MGDTAAGAAAVAAAVLLAVALPGCAVGEAAGAAAGAAAVAVGAAATTGRGTYRHPGADGPRAQSLAFRSPGFRRAPYLDVRVPQQRIRGYEQANQHWAVAEQVRSNKQATYWRGVQNELPFRPDESRKDGKARTLPRPSARKRANSRTLQ